MFPHVYTLWKLCKKRREKVFNRDDDNGITSSGTLSTFLARTNCPPLRVTEEYNNWLLFQRFRGSGYNQILLKKESTA